MKKELLTSFTCQLYVAGIGFLMLPYFLRYLGAEAYGLVGFFVTLQTVMNLLDLGFSPTFGREVASYKAGARSSKALQETLASIEFLFLILAVIIISAGCIGSPWIAKLWLKFESLPLEQVTQALIFMFISVGLRWYSGVYRNGLIGLENHFYVNLINVIFSSFRFPGALIMLMLVSNSPKSFFAFQAILSTLEMIISRILLLHTLSFKTPKVYPSFAALRRIMPISLRLGLTSGIGVIMLNTDKVILSGILDLQHYGYFSLGIAVANGLLFLHSPFHQVLQPRLTILATQNNEDQLILLYRTATQLLSALSITLAGTLIVFARPILIAWTGDPVASENAAPILSLYVAGNGLIILISLPFALQMARGDMRLHFKGAFVTGVIMLPFIVAAAYAFGPVGTGCVWVGLQVISIWIWTPIVHWNFAKEITFKWVLTDVLPMLISGSLVLTIFYLAQLQTDNLIMLAMNIGSCMVLTLISAVLAGNIVRKLLIEYLRKLFCEKE